MTAGGYEDNKEGAHREQRQWQPPLITNSYGDIPIWSACLASVSLARCSWDVGLRIRMHNEVLGSNGDE